MKKFLLFIALSFMIIPVFAQPKGGKPKEEMFKEIQEYKMKFLAQEMELKEDQIARFSELYEKMNSEKHANFREMRKLEKSLKKDASEEEYKLVSDKISDCKAKDAEIDKTYDAKFSTFLSQKQIYKMKAAEEKFRQKMWDMQHKRRAKNKK